MRFSLAFALATAHAFSSAVYAQSDDTSNNRTAYDDVIVRDGSGSRSLSVPLKAVQGVDPGVPIKPDKELRILCIGDSITVGSGSSHRNGYRENLRDNLSGDVVVFAGTEKRDTPMEDGYFSAWGGKTIKFISEHIGPALEQRPNIVLVHAGTNDMNTKHAINEGREGPDPEPAAERLGQMIDQIIEACPDAVVLVAAIINSCAKVQKEFVEEYQYHVSGVVRERLAAGNKVLAVDFAELGDAVLSPDCVHPNDNGYVMMAAQWYNAMTQIPKSWIQAPIGRDPVRPVIKGTAAEVPDASSSNVADKVTGDADADSAAWVGRAAPFWIPTALITTWYLTL